MTCPAVSKHLRILRRSKLVTAKKKGRERIYSLNAGPLRDIEAWIRQYEAFWDQQLQSFKDYVENDKGDKP
jgi:DNA-binding transcriptional ArsR family regulator